MAENYTYPAIIDTSEERFINISFPDFPEAYTCVGIGEDFIAEAQDLLALSVQDRLDRKERLPEINIIPEITDNQQIVFVNIWMPFHKKRIKEVYVKKTLTIPAWLDLLAKENQINFSAVLKEGLKEKLGIE